MRGGLSASVSHFPTSVPITGQGELQFCEPETRVLFTTATVRCKLACG